MEEIWYSREFMVFELNLIAAKLETLVICCGGFILCPEHSPLIVERVMVFN
jgi:hypothetical protein